MKATRSSLVLVDRVDLFSFGSRRRFAQLVAGQFGREPDAVLGQLATVLDAVYRPLETRLLREARERGCRALDGLDWLVHQAVEQVRLWSGATADPLALRRAAEAEL